MHIHLFEMSRRRSRTSSLSNPRSSPARENSNEVVETARNEKRTKRLRQTSTSIEKSIRLLHGEIESVKREMAHLPGLRELSGLREELKGKFILLLFWTFWLLPLTTGILTELEQTVTEGFEKVLEKLGERLDCWSNKLISVVQSVVFNMYCWFCCRLQ